MPHWPATRPTTSLPCNPILEDGTDGQIARANSDGYGAPWTQTQAMAAISAMSKVRHRVVIEEKPAARSAASWPAALR